MEGGGNDFLNCAAQRGLVRQLLEGGDRSIVVSSECEAVVLPRRTSRGDIPSASFRRYGTVVTDQGVVLVSLPSFEVVHHLQNPTCIGGHGEVAGAEHLLHFAHAADDSWECVALFPTPQRSRDVRQAIERLRHGPTPPPLNLAHLVSTRYHWLDDDVRRTLGLPPRASAESAKEKWEKEHRLTHQRKKAELEALRSRSKGRKTKSPAERVAHNDSEMDQSQKRAAEASARLEEQQDKFENAVRQQQADAAGRLLALKLEQSALDNEAQRRREEAEAEQLARLIAQREQETEALEEERRVREQEASLARAKRQEEERRQREHMEQLREERLRAEEEERQKLAAAKAIREEEQERQRKLASLRYEASQRERSERQAFVRQEERDRGAVMEEAAAEWDEVLKMWSAVAYYAACTMRVHSEEGKEETARGDIELLEREARSDLQWERDRQYAHVCEVERRRLMEEEAAARRGLFIEEDIGWGGVVHEVTEGRGFASPVSDFAVLMDDPLDASPTGFRGEERSPPMAVPPPRVSTPPTCPSKMAVVAGSPTRGTQTPSYNFSGGTGVEGDRPGLVAELTALREELRHERELRLRSQERVADHERRMAEKAAQLQERERQLLDQLNTEHNQRLEQVRSALLPRFAAADRYEDADRVLARVAEREEEWVRREAEWRKIQDELEREAARLRADLNRATELHWANEQDRAALRAQCEAAEAEVANARSHAERAEGRLKSLLLEEQELLAKQEAKWKARLAEAEARLSETEGRYQRRVEERERFWVQQEKALKSRVERAESERSGLLQKLHMMQSRVDGVEADGRRLREEARAEAQVASHRAAMEVKAAQEMLDRERSQRRELEDALAKALEDHRHLAMQLEELRNRNALLLRDAKLAQAQHESEVGRLSKAFPKWATREAVLAALETAARYAIIATWQSGLLDMVSQHPPPSHGKRIIAITKPPTGDHTPLLRELLELEEGKVAELERTVRELRRQRDELLRGTHDWSTAGLIQCQLEEAEGRAALEGACKERLVDLLTSGVQERPARSTQPAPKQVLNSGWLLGCKGKGWKQLYVWVDVTRGKVGYSANPRGGNIGSIPLSRILAVEVEMFVDGRTPPPVNRYQQLGFYIETQSGSKYRFCAASVAERTQWIDTLRQAVLAVSSTTWNTPEWMDHPSVYDGYRPPAPGGSPWARAPSSSPPSPTYRRLRSELRHRRQQPAAEPIGFALEHLSYMGLE